MNSKVKRNGMVYNFINAANFDSFDVYSFNNGLMDICQFRMLFIKSLFYAFFLYSVAAFTVLLVLSCLFGTIFFINAYFGADTSYFYHTPEWVQIVSVLTGVISTMLFIVTVVGPFTLRLFVNSITKVITWISKKEFSKNKSEKVKTTPILDMYKSWKGKYCVKVDIVD